MELVLSDDNFDWLNRKMLYELDHKLELENGEWQYADVTLSGALDLSSTFLPSNNSGFTTLTGVQHSNGTDNQFTSQLLKDPDNGTFGNISIFIAGNEYQLTVSNVTNDNTVEVIGGLLDVSTGNYQNPSAITTNQYLTATYKYSGGGVFAHSALLNKLCIRNIANDVNFTNKVDYITVEEDGTLSDDKFVLELDNGVEVIKKSSLTVNVDTEKPKAFGLSNKVIGYQIEKRNFEYFSIMNRQNGEYTVDMTPVITFRELFSAHKIIPDSSNWPQYSAIGTPYTPSNYSYDPHSPEETEISEALYKKLNYCRTQFNLGRVHENKYCPSDSKWGVIKNHFFHKVNEIDTEGVIKLSELDSLPPKYNLIGEIAIDKFDKNSFKSRWEDDFYLRSGGGGKTKTVAGTKNVVEERNYGASSIIKLKDAYEIYNFTSKKYKTLEELNEVKLSGVFEADISIFEDRDIITLDFDLAAGIIKELDTLGVRKTLEKYIDVEDSFGKVDTLDDDVEFYIRENILKLFTINKIDMYVKAQKEKPIGQQSFTSKFNSYVDSVASLSSVSSGNYNIDNSYTYKIDAKNPLNFRLIYNKKKGYNYIIRPLIKIQS